MKLTWSRSTTSVRPLAASSKKALAQPGYGGNVNLPGDSHDRIALFAPDPDGQCLAHSGPPARPWVIVCLCPSARTSPILSWCVPRLPGFGLIGGRAGQFRGGYAASVMGSGAWLKPGYQLVKGVHSGVRSAISTGCCSGTRGRQPTGRWSQTGCGRSGGDQGHVLQVGVRSQGVSVCRGQRAVHSGACRSVGLGQNDLGARVESAGSKSAAGGCAGSHAWSPAFR